MQEERKKNKVTYYHSQSYRAHGEEGEGDLIPVDGEPPCHPAEQQDPEEEEGSHVEQRVALVAQRGLRLPGDDEELAGVEEDRVDLHHEGEGSVSHVLPAHDTDSKAENNKEVVDEQLVGRPLPVVDQHVQRIVDEVSDREGDESMH